MNVREPRRARKRRSRVRDLEPEVVLVDVAMDDSLDTVRAIGEARPKAKVVALAVADTEADVIACAEAGACGYVHETELLMTSRPSSKTSRGRDPLLAEDQQASLRPGRRPGRRASRAIPQLDVDRPGMEVAELLDQAFRTRRSRNVSASRFPPSRTTCRILGKLHVQRRTEAAARLK